MVLTINATVSLNSIKEKNIQQLKLHSDEGRHKISNEKSEAK
jgi:hypothetical protein